MRRVHPFDESRVRNLRWLFCLAGLALPAGAGAAADAGGPSAWGWVGGYWSLPPAGSATRLLVPADPTQWSGGVVLTGPLAPPASAADGPPAAGGPAPVDPWSALGFRPDGLRRAL